MARARSRKHWHSKRKHDLAMRREKLETDLRRRHGITGEDLARMFERQDGKCAGCVGALLLNKDTHVDHDHLTGRLRGLLCSSCNRGLGYLKDSPEILSRLALHVTAGSTGE